MKNFLFYKQPDEMDCGPTCLRMIAKHYGRSISLQKLRAISETTREGSTLKNIAEAAENIGFRSLGVKIDFEKLKEDAPLPCIVFWQQQHFVVVYKITKKQVFVADPGRSEEHTSELQSRPHLVCRLLLEKKKTKIIIIVLYFIILIY